MNLVGPVEILTKVTDSAIVSNLAGACKAIHSVIASSITTWITATVIEVYKKREYD